MTFWDLGRKTFDRQQQKAEKRSLIFCFRKTFLCPDLRIVSFKGGHLNRNTLCLGFCDDLFHSTIPWMNLYVYSKVPFLFSEQSKAREKTAPEMQLLLFCHCYCYCYCFFLIFIAIVNVIVFRSCQSRDPFWECSSFCVDLTTAS